MKVTGMSNMLFLVKMKSGLIEGLGFFMLCKL